MKRLFPPRGYIVFVLVALGTLLSYRASLPGVGTNSALSLCLSFRDSTSINSTLLRLSSTDPFEPDLRKEVEELVDGTFVSSDPRYRSVSAWRRISSIQERLRSTKLLPISRIYPRIRNVYPEFRRLLRLWWQRRRFQPQILSELADTIKPQLDLHYGKHSSARRYRSCAVVGNSGILMRNERGALIDEHEFVIRLNNARIFGYEKNVGSKTSVSFINSNILNLCSRRDNCYCHPYGSHIPIIMYICQPVHFVEYVVCNNSHRAPLIVTDPRFDLLCSRIINYYSLKRFAEQTGRSPEEWGKFRDAKSFHYSSGMQAVMLAVGICDRVSIFGFGKSVGARHHYHTNQKAELSLHDYEAEYLLYRDLVLRPREIPFFAESGFSVPEVVAYD